ncbi:MAG: heliorhodopsin HeR, partial [Actinomycetota bacterium]|nr:heliorhodopsin HeR [Actinomycetota bacterium]
MIERSIPPKITFSYLRKFNGVMAGLHFVQAMLMLVMGLVITNIKEFTLPLNFNFMSFDFEKMELVLNSETIGNIPIGPLVAVFLFISAIAHFLIVLPKINKFYNSSLEKGINYFRWFEYALSSSVMIVIIAMLFGANDLATVVLIVGLNATMNLLGLMMELHNQTTRRTNW